MLHRGAWPWWPHLVPFESRCPQPVWSHVDQPTQLPEWGNRRVYGSGPSLTDWKFSEWSLWPPPTPGHREGRTAQPAASLWKQSGTVENWWAEKQEQVLLESKGRGGGGSAGCPEPPQGPGTSSQGSATADPGAWG